MDAEILSQLIQIKWLLVVFVGIALVNAIARTSLEFSRTRSLRTLGQPSFKRSAQSLLENAQWKDLLVLADARCREAPGDAYGFWYRAYAAHALGDVAGALSSMQRVGELAPDWRESYVDPFIRALGTPG
ncbi:MAG TPA: hypothetical protein VFA81_02090 [Burkholderiales bacterium]|nr:hypothetical protein [Burkholderiales bacterium]